MSGVVLSALSLGHASAFCADGPARGAPFVVVRPAHEITVSSIFVGAVDKVPSEVWLPGFAGNLLLWSAVGALAIFGFERLRGRR